MTITASQCRAARGLLGWSQDQLEAAANVARKTIVDFERGARRPHPRTLDALRSAFEIGGVEFIEPSDETGPGLRLRSGAGVT